MRQLRLCAAAALLLVGMSGLASPRRAWVAIGDSETYGYNHDATPYPARLATLLGAPVANMGVGGELAASIYNRYGNHAATYPYKGVIAWPCINDLIASATGATCWATTEDLADDAIAAGQLVVLITAIPCGNYSGWDGTKEMERDAYNTLLRAYVVAHAGEAFLLDADTVLSDDGATIKASYDYGDGLHMNGTGMQALAEALDALIQ